MDDDDISFHNAGLGSKHFQWILIEIQACVLNFKEANLLGFCIYFGNAYMQTIGTGVK